MSADSNLPVVMRGAGYAINGVRILSSIDLEITPGAPLILMGPNGAGKSTLIRLAAGLRALGEGSIAWGGKPKPHGRRIAVVFQRPVMLRRSAAENIAYARRAAGLSADSQSVGALLDRVSLGGLGGRPARALSGGEQQRLALGRALAREPELLFLDEPAANLDPPSAAMTEAIIRAAVKTGVTIVIATHDAHQAKRLGADVVFLSEGRIAERAPAQTFFASPRTEAARRYLAGELLPESSAGQHGRISHA